MWAVIVFLYSGHSVEEQFATFGEAAERYARLSAHGCKVRLVRVAKER